MPSKNNCVTFGRTLIGRMACSDWSIKIKIYKIEISASFLDDGLASQLAPSNRSKIRCNENSWMSPWTPTWLIQKAIYWNQRGNLLLTTLNPNPNPIPILTYPDNIFKACPSSTFLSRTSLRVQVAASTITTIFPRNASWIANSNCTYYLALRVVVHALVYKPSRIFVVTITRSSTTLAAAVVVDRRGTTEIGRRIGTNRTEIGATCISARRGCVYAIGNTTSDQSGTKHENRVEDCVKRRTDLFHESLFNGQTVSWLRAIPF